MSTQDDARRLHKGKPANFNLSLATFERLIGPSNKFMYTYHENLYICTPNLNGR